MRAKENPVPRAPTSLARLGFATDLDDPDDLRHLIGRATLRPRAARVLERLRLGSIHAA